MKYGEKILMKDDYTEYIRHKMLHEGYTLEMLGNAIGITKEGIRQVLSGNGSLKRVRAICKELDIPLSRLLKSYKGTSAEANDLTEEIKKLPTLITIKQAAKMLGSDYWTVYNMAKKGVFSKVIIGERTIRLPQEEVIDYINGFLNK